MKKLLVVILAVSLISSFSNYASAQGFEPTHINWSVPAGGVNYPTYAGFTFDEFSSASTYTEESQNWVIMDMDGDGLKDLVITGERMLSNSLAQAFDVDSIPHWKVYLSNGTGFSNTATIWALPAGGRVQSGTNCSFPVASETNTFSYDVGTLVWTMKDMNADGKSDLVVTAEKISSTGNAVFEVGNNPHWKVYLNTGSGFESNPTNWTVPAGGFIAGGTNYGFSSTSFSNHTSGDDGTMCWDLIDIDGDYLLDLVVTSEKVSGSTTVFDPQGSPYWKVYKNNAGGFTTTATNWSVPTGGTIVGGVQTGYRVTQESSAGTYSNGSKNWSTIDLNGDLKPDLVVTSEKFGSGTTTVYDPTNSPYWKVYFNNGTSFDNAEVNFGLPVGGTIVVGNQSGFRNTEHNNASSYDVGSLNWSLIKINDDDKPDLVVTSEKFGAGNTTVFDPTGNPYWKVYFNVGTSFAAQTNWSIPPVGLIFGTDRGAVFKRGTDADVYDIGSRNWFVEDMDNNGNADIIFTSEHVANGDVEVFDLGSNPYWRAHLNTFVGMDEIPAENHTLLYPNPATNAFQLKTESDYQQLWIFDQLGRKVRVYNKANLYDTSTLQNGLYMVVLVDIDNVQIGETIRLQVVK